MNESPPSAITMNSKERYRILCDHERSIPIFSRDWWLDAVSNEAWDVSLVEKGIKYFQCRIA